jgi:serine/threonine-protein kinase RIO1
LAQLGVGHNTLQQGLFELYTHSRGWIIKKADIQFFQKCMEQRNRERYNRYQKKIFRNCSAFKKVRHFTKSIMYDRQFEAKEFVELLQNPEKIFSARTTIFLKKGRSSTVAKIQVDNRTLVIKRYNIKNVWHALRRALRETRAVKSWRDAHHIFAAGIRTPKPIAFIENQCLGFRGKSYFIMEYVAGNDVGDYFDSHREDQKMIEQMANRLLELFNQLATLSLTHGDLKKTNILVDKTWPVLIDMDAIAEHYSKWGLKSAFSNEIKRFMRNWEKEPALCNLFHNLLENHGQTSAINAR